MPFIIQLHLGLANTASLFSFALSVWAFYRFFRGQGVDGSYFGAIVIGEILMICQSLTGFTLLFSGLSLARMSLHVLYGLCTILSFPALYMYSQGRDSRQEMLLWGLITFFVFGLTLRLYQIM